MELRGNLRHWANFLIQLILENKSLAQMKIIENYCKNSIFLAARDEIIILNKSKLWNFHLRNVSATAEVEDEAKIWKVRVVKENLLEPAPLSYHAHFQPSWTIVPVLSCFSIYLDKFSLISRINIQMSVSIKDEKMFIKIQLFSFILISREIHSLAASCPVHFRPNYYYCY